eukprot:6206417-Pleurochrysis_carterae.AAC.1
MQGWAQGIIMLPARSMRKARVPCSFRRPPSIHRAMPCGLRSGPPRGAAHPAPLMRDCEIARAQMCALLCHPTKGMSQSGSSR